MNEPTSERGSIPASAYARCAPSYMSSFQEKSGVVGRNGVTPTPTMPTRMGSPLSGMADGRRPCAAERQSVHKPMETLAGQRLSIRHALKFTVDRVVPRYRDGRHGPPAGQDHHDPVPADEGRSSHGHVPGPRRMGVGREA